MEDRYNNEIQLKEILIKFSEYKTFLLQNKLKIIAFSFFTFIIGIAVAYTSSVKYHAQLTFVVEEEKGRSALGGVSGIASQFGFDLGISESSTFSQSNVIELLKSRGVVERALMESAVVNGKDDLLIEHYLEINNIHEYWADNDDLQWVSFHEVSSYAHDSIMRIVWVDIIDNHLNIDLFSDEANIIALSYSSKDQQFAKEITEELIDEMTEMYIAHQTSQANKTLSFLQDRADSIFGELQIAEQEFARVKDINSRIVKASGRLRELQLMRSVEVLNTMYLEIIKNLELSKITLLNKTPIINIIDKPILPLEEDETSKKMAGLLGGLLGGLLSLMYFVFKKLIQDSIQGFKEN